MKTADQTGQVIEVINIIPAETLKAHEITVAEAMAIKVVDENTFQTASHYLLQFSDMTKFIQKRCKDERDPLEKMKKAIIAYEKMNLEKIRPALVYLKDQITAYHEKVKLAAEKAEKEALEKAALQAEEDKIGRAAAAHAAGNPDQAEAILQEEVKPVVPIVSKKPVKVPGLAVVEKWAWTLIDKSQVPLKYLQLDKVAINNEVRKEKGRTNIPGIKVYHWNDTKRVRSE